MNRSSSSASLAVLCVASDASRNRGSTLTNDPLPIHILHSSVREFAETPPHRRRVAMYFRRPALTVQEKLRSSQRRSHVLFIGTTQCAGLSSLSRPHPRLHIRFQFLHCVSHRILECRQDSLILGKGVK